MELGRSLVKKAFRAKKIPSPRCGGGSGWGGESNAVIAFSECPLPPSAAQTRERLPLRKEDRFRYILGEATNHLSDTFLREAIGPHLDLPQALGEGPLFRFAVRRCHVFSAPSSRW